MSESAPSEPGSSVVQRAEQQDDVTPLREPEAVDEAAPNQVQAAASALIERLLRFGIDGAGPWKGAVATAEETLASCADSEQAIQKLIVTHRVLVGTSGFVTGLGGLAPPPGVHLRGEPYSPSLSSRALGPAISMQGTSVRPSIVHELIQEGIPHPESGARCGPAADKSHSEMADPVSHWGNCCPCGDSSRGCHW